VSQEERPSLVYCYVITLSQTLCFMASSPQHPISVTAICNELVEGRRAVGSIRYPSALDTLECYKPEGRGLETPMK
jgi:hypothetical protein